MKGIDCSTAVTATVADKLKDAGVEFVMRYIFPKDFKSWKQMKKAELDLLLKKGFQVGFIYQRGRDTIREGYNTGVVDGKNTLQALEDLGVNAKVAVYYAVDYDAPATDFKHIHAYLKGVRDAVGGKVFVGVYGSYGVLEGLHELGSADKYWQTLAWSRGKKSKHMNVYQREIDKPYCGINVDHNDSFGGEGFLLPSKSGLTNKPSKPVPVKKPVAKVSPKGTATATKTKTPRIKRVGTIKVTKVVNYTFIYDRPANDALVVGKANKNAVFPIAGSVVGWYEVIHKDKRCYIRSKYAERV